MLGVKKGRRNRKGHDKLAAASRADIAGRPTPGKREYRVMTVALIRDQEGLEAVEVAFSESARFYRLPRGNPEFERILRALHKAKEKRRPVCVLLESPESSLIEDVEADG